MLLFLKAIGCQRLLRITFPHMGSAMQYILLVFLMCKVIFSVNFFPARFRLDQYVYLKQNYVRICNMYTLLHTYVYVYLGFNVCSNYINAHNVYARYTRVFASCRHEVVHNQIIMSEVGLIVLQTNVDQEVLGI